MYLFSSHILNVARRVAMAALFAGFAACNTDDLTIPEDSGQELALNVITTGFTTDTPATYASESGYQTLFASGDQIGITVVTQDGTTILHDNIKCVYDGSSWTPDGGTKIYKYPGATYFAYYPYDVANDSKTTVAEIVNAFDPQIDQSNYATGYTVSDLMTWNGSTPSGTALDITFAHALALIEVQLPAGATNPSLKIDNGSALTPYVDNETARWIVKPATNVKLSGTCTIGAEPAKWEQNDITLEAGKYRKVNITISGYVGDIKITYTDTDEETVPYYTLEKKIPFTESNKTIKQIELPDAGNKTYLIGRATEDGPLYLNLDDEGDLIFRPADTDEFIPIGSYAEFQLINTVSEALIGNYIQDADIDLLSEEWTPVGVFSGTFDGNGFTLVNLKIDDSYNNEKGLFGHNTGSLKNIRIISGSVVGQEVIGSVCGVNGGTVTGCSNTGCTVSGTHHVGGLCGNNSGSGTIRNSYNTADITVVNMNVGGVCGRNYGNLIACYNSGNISNSGAFTGGVCGTNGSNITACYNAGSVYSVQYSNGGVCGHNENNGEIKACYSIGLFSGGWDNGGVCGRNQQGTIAGCYYKAGVGASFGIGGIGTADGGNSATTTPTDENALPFTIIQWPDPVDAWGTGDGSENQYWKSLGDFSSDEYPKLWFEP
jgi:hypothetical protein